MKMILHFQSKYLLFLYKNKFLPLGFLNFPDHIYLFLMQYK